MYVSQRSKNIVSEQLPHVPVNRRRRIFWIDGIDTEVFWIGAFGSNWHWLVSLSSPSPLLPPSSSSTFTTILYNNRQAKVITASNSIRLDIESNTKANRQTIKNTMRSLLISCIVSVSTVHAFTGVVVPTTSIFPNARPLSTLLYAVEGSTITMPALSSTMKEGRVVSWLKQEGDPISAGEAIMVVESDKADVRLRQHFHCPWLL